MIALAANKSIMRSKFPNNAFFKFRSHDRFVSRKNNHEIETLKSIIRQFGSHENCRDQEIELIIRNFDLMKTGKIIQSHDQKIIGSHEQVYFDLMKFDLLTLSR